MKNKRLSPVSVFEIPDPMSGNNDLVGEINQFIDSNKDNSDFTRDLIGQVTKKSQSFMTDVSQIDIVKSAGINRAQMSGLLNLLKTEVKDESALRVINYMIDKAQQIECGNFGKIWRDNIFPIKIKPSKDHTLLLNLDKSIAAGIDISHIIPEEGTLVIFPGNIRQTITKQEFETFTNLLSHLKTQADDIVGNEGIRIADNDSNEQMYQNMIGMINKLGKSVPDNFSKDLIKPFQYLYKSILAGLVQNKIVGRKGYDSAISICNSFRINPGLVVPNYQSPSWASINPKTKGGEIAINALKKIGLDVRTRDGPGKNNST